MRIDQTARVLARAAKPIIEDYLSVKLKLLGRKVSAKDAESLSTEIVPRFVELILKDEDLHLREQLSIEVRQLVLNYFAKAGGGE